MTAWIEGDQRLGDPVEGAVRSEHVYLAGDQARILKNAERMGEIGGRAGQVARDPAPGGIALQGDRREH